MTTRVVWRVSTGLRQVKKLERSGALRAVQERVHSEAELKSRLQRCHRSVPSIRTALMSQVSDACGAASVCTASTLTPRQGSGSVKRVHVNG